MPESDYPFASAAQSDMEEHGEIHCIFDEHDEEVELRSEVTEFKFSEGLISVEGPDHVENLRMENLIRFYKPTEVFH